MVPKEGLVKVLDDEEQALRKSKRVVAVQNSANHFFVLVEAVAMAGYLMSSVDAVGVTEYYHSRFAARKANLEAAAVRWGIDTRNHSAGQSLPLQRGEIATCL